MSLAEGEIDQLLASPSDALDELDRIECEESLYSFTRRMWSILEPANPMVEGWAMEAICEHLEAVSDGHIQKLLINVPPGFSKSLLVNVFWPAWLWGPKRKSHIRQLTFSYTSILTERDNRRFRDVLLSHDYGRLFGERFKLIKAGEQLVSNDKTGWKLATSIGGVGTGERGDIVALDDPNNVKDSESDTVREETNRWVREGMSNRLNDPARSSIVAIQQRTHEMDVSGLILTEMRHDFEHLLIPMEWEGQRQISTVPAMKWTDDPRTVVGELAWPQRYTPLVVRNLKITVGPYAWAGQYQQTPTPRGGGILKRDWWQVWDPPPDQNGHQRLPRCEFVVASFDGAFGQKQENDYSALTVWGLFKNAPGVLPSSTRMTTPYLEQIMGEGKLSAPLNPSRFIQPSKLILMQAWQKRLPLNGLEIEREVGETDAAYRARAMPHWGIVQFVADTCKRFNVNMLLIEAKANGIDVANEVKRQYAGEGWGMKLIEPKTDKVARAYSVQHILADAMVYAPDREWAEDVITVCASFPKVAHDDIVDSTTQAWKWLRDAGLLRHGHEIERDFADELAYKPAQTKALYDV